MSDHILIPCPTCNGTGIRWRGRLNDLGEWVQCEHCLGSATVKEKAPPKEANGGANGKRKLSRSDVSIAICIVNDKKRRRKA